MLHLKCLLGLLSLLNLASLVIAHQARDVKATIYEPSKKYAYYGCYNETTQVSGTSGARALDGGSHLVTKNNMTVPLCLEFCSSNGTQYTYAGLEWSRECWCADNIAAVAEKLNDSQCSYECEGNSSQICGGSLKLTIYTFSSAPLGPQISAVLLAATVLAVLII